ncbi:MAG TPA: T9SS type A sorting domain-containing protein [Candidatus Marinimicrobia bacterium]|nr:T9SS type A sorting domain-containing protein [Candidatus Neomarinimicrobiota bacterium]
MIIFPLFFKRTGCLLIATAISLFASLKAPQGKYSRPDYLTEYYISESGRFKLYFDNTGINAVPQTYDQNPRVPDFIIMAGHYLEYSYDYLADTLGFRTPPIDDDANPEIDIYFTNLGDGNYGATTPERLASNTMQPYAYTGYIEIDNDFVGSSFYTNGYEALKVTCAHELFHIFQIGYNLWEFSSEEIWFYECSSTWVEDQVFPEVNDYIQYVNSYVRNWGKSLDDYIYDNVSWLLEMQHLDHRAIRLMWENVLTMRVWKAIDTYVINEMGRNEWPRLMSEWGVSHIFAGKSGHLDKSHFPDAHLMPELIIPPSHYFDLADAESEHFELNISNSYSHQFWLIENLEPVLMAFSVSGLPESALQLVFFSGERSGAFYLNEQPALLDLRGAMPQVYVTVGVGALESPAKLILQVTKFPDYFIGIFPNPAPAPEKIYIQYNLSEDYAGGTLEIFNLRGARIFKNSINQAAAQQGENSLWLPEIHLASGVYFLRLSFPHIVFQEKFLILK